MKVAIDALQLNHGGRGMARFAAQFAEHFPGNMVQLTPPKTAAGRWLARLQPIWEQIVLPALSRRAGVSLLVCPYNTAPMFIHRSIARIVIVHDLIFLHESVFAGGSVTQQIGRLYRKLVVPIVVRRASRVITVSEYSKSQIVSAFKLPESKIDVVYNTIQPCFEDASISLARIPGLIFTVSGDGVSKNLERLLQAFRIVAEDDPNAKLVVAGVNAKMHEKYAVMSGELHSAGRISFLPRVDDAELVKWYGQCQFFICASLMEGFGIPVIEAMACGAPVFSSNTTALPEICGEAAEYFNPYDVPDIARALRAGLDENRPTDSKVEIGLKRSKLFGQRAFDKTCALFWEKIHAAH